MFVDRKEELKFLEKEYSKNSYSFIVLYGRRRVGKTELIKKFIKGKQHIYFLVSQEPTNIQLSRLVLRIAEHFRERPPMVRDWVEVVDYTGEKFRKDKIILAIDEFPYLVEANKSIPSYFQKLVDEYLKGSTSMLILSGSSIGIMESKVLGHKSPLYGRRTGQIDLEPFDFEKLRLIVKGDAKECIEAGAVFGNTPMYLNFFDNSESLRNNILNNILNKNAFLHKEPELILKQEFREPAKYMSIIGAIANGNTKLNTISGATQIPQHILSKYIGNLMKVRLIEREVAVTERQKTKKSLYSVKDGLFNFWFTFVQPYLSDVETNPAKFLDSVIMPGLPGFVSNTFEKVCRELVRKNYDYSPVGRWWYKDTEIDIVGLKKQAILFGECKWKNNVNAEKVLAELKEKSKLVQWRNKNRKEEFVIFAKGFARRTSEAKCYDLKDIEKII